MVKVRSLRPYEGQKLEALLHSGKDAIAVRRAEVALRSDQGEDLKSIAKDLYFSYEYVRQIVHRFNEEGLASLKAHYDNGGRPKSLEPEHESELVELALTPPRLIGQPFTHWSLQTLMEVAIKRKLIPKVSLETVRQALLNHRLTLQKTKTWKQSKDPLFELKKSASNGSTKRAKKAGSESSASTSSGR